VVPKRVVKSERKSAIKPDKSAKNDPPLRMFLVPCSCGMTFAVAQNYDHQGTA
jgi:hypothetical protein